MRQKLAQLPFLSSRRLHGAEVGGIWRSAERSVIHKVVAGLYMSVGL